MFEGVLSSSMLEKAKRKRLVQYTIINLRDFGIGSRKTVDDTPYGGGSGMLLMIEPLSNAIKFAKQKDKEALVILPTPAGETYLQSSAKKLSSEKGLIIVCPRYEGYDERVLEYVDKTFRIGNYVLTGGEIPAMVIIDSVSRLIPGVLGGENSKEIESFYEDDQSVEFPQYTRPETFGGSEVPRVLLSGNHKEIEIWRNKHKK